MKSTMKRALCGLISVIMLCSMLVGLVGCGEETGGTDHIVMTYIYGMAIPKDLEKVEKAVSDYAFEKSALL